MLMPRGQGAQRHWHGIWGIQVSRLLRKGWGVVPRKSMAGKLGAYRETEGSERMRTI